MASQHPVKNSEVLHVWELKDATGGALTGLDGNMTATLSRFADSSTQASATETVTIAEIGSTGFYAITYTPTNAQVYKGRITESSLYLEYTWEDQVTDSAAASVADNAYCSEADVVAWAQMGDYTASTTPTETQVLGFMQMRAGELYGVLAKWMATPVGPSGASGYATEIDTSTDKGFALNEQLRMANAIGAAMDALQAAGASEAPSRTERVEELSVAYAAIVANLEHLAREYEGNVDAVATHITSGEITQASVTAQEEDGRTFDGSTKF
jgi:hypothetical protein